MGPQLKYADKRGAPCVVIQGGDEKAKGEVQIKDLVEGARKSEAIASNKEWRETRPAQFSVPEAELGRGRAKSPRAPRHTLNALPLSPFTGRGWRARRSPKGEGAASRVRGRRSQRETSKPPHPARLRSASAGRPLPAALASVSERPARPRNKCRAGHSP